MEEYRFWGGEKQLYYKIKVSMKSRSKTDTDLFSTKVKSSLIVYKCMLIFIAWIQVGACISTAMFSCHIVTKDNPRLRLKRYLG